MPTLKKQIRTKIKRLASQDVKKSIEIPAFLGNSAGVVKADTLNNVYVILNTGEVLTVLNVRVPNVFRLPVIIGYDPTNPKVLQVLRSRKTYVDNPYPDVAEHANVTHQWPGPDTAWIRGEQYLPGLAIPSTGLIVQFYGFVYFLNGYKLINNQLIDLTASVPTSGAKYALVEVDTAGAISVSLSAAVAGRGNLTYGDIPIPTAGKAPLFAVKLYLGQTEIIKDILDTDIIDLRSSGYATGIPRMTAGRVVVTDQTTGDVTTDSGFNYNNATNQLSLTRTGATSGPVFDLSSSYTDLSAQTPGVRLVMAVNPTVNNSQVTIGADLELKLQGAFQKLGNQRVLILRPTNEGSGNMNNLRGLEIQATYSAGGTTVQNIGALIQAPAISGGSLITNSYGVYIAAQGNAGITGGENMALYIADVTGSGSTMYSIFTNLGLNRFGDGLFLDGSTDRIQQRIQGHTVQTNLLQTYETSAGTVVGSVGGTGATIISPTDQVVGLKIVNPGTPTVNAFETYDAPGSFTGGISYDGRLGFSNITAQAGPASDIGARFYYRANLADVYGVAAYGYLLDTTTGGRRVTGLYVEGQIHSSQTQGAGGAVGIQLLAGNTAAITNSLTRVIQVGINNSNAASITTAAYGAQIQINSNAGSITNLYGIRIGNTANGDFASGTVTNAYGLYINPIDSTTLSYGIYINTPTATTARSIFTAGGIAEFTGSTASQGLILTTTGLGLDNNQRIFWKNTGGSYVVSILVDGGNQLAFRAPGANGIRWATSGDVNLLTLTESGTLTVYNATVTTGITRFNIRAGAGQSTNDLQQWQKNDATALTRVGSVGQLGVVVDTAANPAFYVERLSSTRFFAVNGATGRVSIISELFADNGAGVINMTGTITRNGVGSVSGIFLGNTFDPSSSSSDQYGINIVPTINQTGTASGAVTLLRIRPTYTAVLGTLKTVEIFDGATSVLSIDRFGGAVFNDGGNAAGDLRWESDTETDMLFGDADANTDGALYFGGSTNGVKVKKGGLLSFIGTAQIEDATNIPLGTGTGTKIGTATNQKLSVWNATPIIQPTTAIAAATFVTNSSLIFDDSATFDGYTIGQVVKALRNMGILA